MSPRRTNLLAAGALVAAGLPLSIAALSGSASADLAAPAAVPPAAPALAAAPPAARPPQGTRGVIANLWLWNWRSIARECTTVLGPGGYSGVQVAPPQDSLKRQRLGDGSDTVLHPWWEVYQPASYALTSRMGTEAEFRAMVRTCRAAGVEVYVDAVINHMTGQGDRSYAGVTYEKYRYRGLYSPRDFHRYPQDCPVPPEAGAAGERAGNIADFNDYTEVFRCELVGLSDLDTASPYVQRQLAAYLNRLLSLGVSGFRVDAAKHIGQADLDAIYSRLRRTVDGERPYWALEVIPGGPGRLTPWAFLRSGSLLGFDVEGQLQSAFKSYGSPPNDGNIGDLRVWGEAAGLLPSRKSLAFVQNHDTERGGALSYKDGATNVLAHAFLLASGYGTPQVYSSFTWTERDGSPPADGDGVVTDTVCGPQWTCLDRDPTVLAFVRFHGYAGSAPWRNWYDDGINLLAFSRGDRGWVAINNSTTARRYDFRTGLPAGTYCDAVSGGEQGGRCAGTRVVVRAGGRATVTVPAKAAVLLSRQERVRS